MRKNIYLWVFVVGMFGMGFWGVSGCKSVSSDSLYYTQDLDPDDIKDWQSYSIKHKLISSPSREDLDIFYWKDKNTGIFWTNGVNDNSSVISLSLEEASKYCENLNYAGYSDWYIPSEKDLDQACSDGIYKLDHSPGLGSLYVSFGYFSSSSKIGGLIYLSTCYKSEMQQSDSKQGTLCVRKD